MDGNKIYIALTFDTDNDPYFGEYNPLDAKDILSWKGIEEGIPIILENIEDCENLFGTEIKKTWFVRSDNQLKEIYGDTGYLLKKYSTLWNKQVIEGDEIGLHPHIYRQFNGEWIQETRPEYLIKKIRDGYDAMKENNFNPLSSRIGEAYMSNEIVSILNKLGIKIDSTAMPGRARKDAKFQLDWLGAPQLPYHPSKDDYRVPGEDQLNLLEVPMSMIYTKVEYDMKPLKRYVNLSFHNDVMKDGLRKYIREYKLLVSITHPFEVLPSMYDKGKKHPLISFNMGEIKKNIDFIISECKNAGKEYRFIRISDLSNKNIYEDILNRG
jgi:hypothetical protein